LGLIFDLNLGIDANSCAAPRGHMYPQNIRPKKRVSPRKIAIRIADEKRRIGSAKSAKKFWVIRTTLGTPPRMHPPKTRIIESSKILNLLSNLFFRTSIAAAKPTEIKTTNAKTTRSLFPSWGKYGFWKNSIIVPGFSNTIESPSQSIEAGSICTEKPVQKTAGRN
jgi:hypothetical protein